MRNLAGIATLTIALVLLGCSAPAKAPHNQETAQASQGTAPALNFPPPPQVRIQRDLSEITAWEVWGNSVGLKGGTYSAEGNTLILTSLPNNELSFAVYELYAGTYDFDTVYFEINDVVNPDSLWYGISDYGLGGWRWTQYTEGSASIDVSGFAAKGDGGAAYFAVAEWGGGAARMVKTWIELDKPIWVKEPVSLNAGMGQVNGLAMVAGWPCIAAVDQVAADEFNIHYFRSSVNHPGFGDWDDTLIRAGFLENLRALELIGDEGFLPSIAIIESHGPLWYLYSAASAPGSEGDWTSCGIGSATDSELGFEIVSGFPAVIYNALSLPGGEDLYYARGDRANPSDPAHWDFFKIAGTSSPDQEYRGLSLAAIHGDLPAIQYWDNLVSEHRYATSEYALPGSPDQLFTSAVHIPSLGGADSATVNWQDTPALFYDSVNSTDPRFARGAVTMPTSAGDFEYHHRILGRGSENIVAFANDQWVGAAWRDMQTGGVMFAMYDYIPQFGPDSGSDWKVALVDDRNTAGEIGLTSIFGGVPAICYHATADGLLYFARMVPTT